MRVACLGRESHPAESRIACSCRGPVPTGIVSSSDRCAAERRGVYMIRLALTWYLVLATAAGPLWCCCSSARLVSACNALIAADSTGVPAGPSSCCGDRSQSLPAGDPEGQGRPLPDSPSQPCPCHTPGVGDQIAALSTESTAQAGVRSDDCAGGHFGDPPPASMVDLAGMLTTGHDRQTPAHAPQRLAALQVWRC
jgi:hypothetical protein